MGEFEMKTCSDFLNSFITGIVATISLSGGYTWSDVTLIRPAEGHIRESRNKDNGRWKTTEVAFGVTAETLMNKSQISFR
jgi:hypothetical protein